MTENEIKNTKKWFEDFIETYALSNQETVEFQKAVACLEEIQKYRAIGTVEELEAMKKGTLSAMELADIWCVLEDLKKYSAIGTIEEFKALKEKSVAKKPIRNDLCMCPSCGTYNEVVKKRRNAVAFDTVYCWYCGQAMKV